MLVTGSMEEVRTRRWDEPGRTWGLVPTMGYLHEAHLSLVRRARQENDRVAVSIFVNPTQFAPGEDLDTYPRDLERDLLLLETEGIEIAFTPTGALMYPSGYQTFVTVEEVSRPLEGTSRPSHFRGVATVVAKLFHIVEPTRAYFGQKDAQQTVVIRRLVDDLHFNLELVICETVREADGLAMSSRNARLSPAERQAAPVLYHALCAVRSSLAGGERNAAALRSDLQRHVGVEPLARLDYVSVAHPETLLELEVVESKALLSLAVRFGEVRLIDNLLVDAPGRDGVSRAARS